MTDIPQALVEKAAHAIDPGAFRYCTPDDEAWRETIRRRIERDTEPVRAEARKRARAVLDSVWPDVTPAASRDALVRSVAEAMYARVMVETRDEWPLFDHLPLAAREGWLDSARFAIPPGVVADAADVRRQTAEDIREVINRQRDPEPDNRADWDDGDWREDTAFQTAEGIAYGVGAGCDCGWPESHLPACKLNKDAAREVGGDHG